MRSFVISIFSILSACASATLSNGGFSITLENRAASKARSLAPRAGDQGTSEVEAIYQGTDWVTSLTVGGQVLRAQVDTGSGDLWFISSLVDEATKKNYSTNNFFDPSKSKTWQLEPDFTFNSTYDVGELGAYGIVGTETIELGGVTVTSMAIGAATSIFGVGALDTEYDGVMGLGFGALQSNILNDAGERAGAPTFMQAAQAQLSLPVFTLDFRTNQPETISFGFINDKLYTGQLAKLPIDNSTSYWTVTDVTFTSGSTKLGSTAGVQVIFDSGGVGTTVDGQTASDYWALVSGSSVQENSYVFPCNTKTLPDLTFHFSTGAMATINGSILNETSRTADGVTCVGGVQATANGVLNAGNGFFGSYFSVFNQADPSVSFAPYSTVEDSGAENEANLPTATDALGLPSATAHSAAGRTIGNSVFALVVAVMISSVL